MAPLIAEPGMTAVLPKAALAASTPESAIATVAPERMALAAGRKAPTVAAIPEAALTVVTLTINVARDPVEIAVEMPPLAPAQISISPEGPFFAAHVAGLTLQVARFAARQIALPHALADALLLRLLACVDTALAHAALALRRHDGRRGHACEQCYQQCTDRHALHDFLRFKLMPVLRGPRSALAAGGAPLDPGVDPC